MILNEVFCNVMVIVWKSEKICYEFGYILKIIENNFIIKVGIIMVSSYI